MPFRTELVVKLVPGGKYQLLHDFIYDHHNGARYVVPTGYVTDFASIPAAFQWLISKDELRRAATLHDWLVSEKIVKRERADKIFKTAMKDSGVPQWKRELAYYAVKLFTKTLDHEYRRTNKRH